MNQSSGDPMDFETNDDLITFADGARKRFRASARALMRGYIKPGRPPEHRAIILEALDTMIPFCSGMGKHIAKALHALVRKRGTTAISDRDLDSALDAALARHAKEL